jgi:hypothetical protein
LTDGVREQHVRFSVARVKRLHVGRVPGHARPVLPLFAPSCILQGDIALAFTSN